MQFDAFKSSLAGAAPPAGISSPLQALWWQAKGDWHQAHRCCQDSHDENGAWAHAYLHRVEGDLGNARYCYRQAGRSAHSGALEQEWSEIVATLLAPAGDR